MPTVTRTPDEIQLHTKAWDRDNKKIALVPTMGALHEGHLSLIDKAREIADHVVVSIFVNPTQFAEGEDLDDYPRTWESDIKALKDKAVDAVYAPTVSTMYPNGYSTTISLGGPARALETTYRPHFFSGVATVVCKLITGVMPHFAMFGEKDYQQLLVVTQMTADLHLPCEIVPVATVREHDGLALSSRNTYLTPEERKIAPKLYQTLQECAVMIRSNENPDIALKTATKTLEGYGFNVDYVALRNARTLGLVENVTAEPLRLLAAAHLGKPRLIDNIAV